MDRMGDIVVTAGIDTREFERNPVALLSHNSAGWPIGRWSALTKVLATSPPRLDGTLILFPPEAPGPAAGAAWMVENGGMSAVSIGFLPNFNEVEMIFDANGAFTGGLKFNRSVLLETSLVNVPANADALAKSLSGDPRHAHRSLEQALDCWAGTPEGRRAFERVYRRQQRARDLAAIRARGR